MDVESYGSNRRGERPSDAAQEIALERLAMARRACEDYGVRNAVSGYDDVLDKEVQKLRGRTSIFCPPGPIFSQHLSRGRWLPWRTRISMSVNRSKLRVTTST